jgi:uncharacterized repeat protein (TIGR02543 family)
MKMKKAIIFVICLLVVIYATVAVLLIDFKGIGLASAKADDWMIAQYRLVDRNGELVQMETRNIPLYANKETDVKETRSKKTKFESAKLLVNPGHDFDAWWIGDQQYKARAWIPAGLTGTHIEITASWTPRVLRVSFDPQGAPVVPSRIDVRHGDLYGDAITSATNQMVTNPRPNNTFAGWWTTPSSISGGVQITANSTVAITENTTLFARWSGGGGTAVPYTINFHRNGGTGGANMASHTVNAGSSVTLRANTFTNPGHTFIGWATTWNGGVVYSNQATFTPNRSMDLHAVWSVDGSQPQVPTVVTVSFNSNGGSAVSSRNVTVGQAYGTLTTPTRSGHTFNGWINSVGSVVTSSSIVLSPTNHTLTAQWTSNTPSATTATVSFNSNGGSAVSSRNVTVGQPYGTLATPTRSGHTFNGWVDSTGTVVTSSTIVTTGTNHTLTARWIQNTQTQPAQQVTVTYLSMHGGNAIGTKTVTVGQPYGTLATPIRTGWTFDGWETVDGVRVTSTSLVLVWSNHTLIARWK